MRRLICLLAVLGCATTATAEPVGNGGVIALHQAGLSGAAIAAKVGSGPCDYDTSTGGLIALRRAGVPQQAIVAVIERCAAAGAWSGNGSGSGAAEQGPHHETGIFLQGTPGGEAMLRPSAMPSLKLTGNGSILFPSMAKLIVPQASAQVVARTPRPVFAFRFTPMRPAVGDFGYPTTEGAQSPTEFSLVRFRIDKGNRQITVGRVQPYVEISGIDPNNTLPFTVKELGEGMFRVEMPQDLAPGQYGFVLVGERERRKGTVFRVYDFGVAPGS